jgi:hypothetical protein
MRRDHRIAVAAAALLAGCSLFGPASSRSAIAAEATEVCPIPKVIVPRPADSEKWPAWVAARVQELQPTRQERKIDQIGWARSILAAETLARENGRPVFLFTHDGRINTGRC